jgi:hypothetical protein
MSEFKTGRDYLRIPRSFLGENWSNESNVHERETLHSPGTAVFTRLT